MRRGGGRSRDGQNDQEHEQDNEDPDDGQLTPGPRSIQHRLDLFLGGRKPGGGAVQLLVEFVQQLRAVGGACSCVRLGRKVL